MSDAVNSDGTFPAIVNKQATREDIPREEINEAMKATKMAFVKVMRRNDKGHLAYCERKMRDLSDLLVFEDTLREQYGGGRYRIEVFPPEEPHRYLVPPFHVIIEGLSKAINRAPPVQFLPNGMALVQTTQGPIEVPQQMVPQIVQGYTASGSQGHIPQPVPYQPAVTPTGEQPTMTTPPYYSGLSPALQAAHQLAYGAAQPSAPAATMASDQALAQQIEILRAEAERERSEFKSLVTKLEERATAKDDEVRRIRESLETERRAAEQRQHQMELESLRREMQLTTASAKPVDEGAKIEGYAKVLAAISPVLAAMAGSGKESSKLVAESTMEAQKAQMQMMQALMGFVAQGSQRPSEISTVMPMLLKMMEQKSPEAQATLISTMAENSMSQMAMMAQFVQAMAAQSGADGPPWWLPMVEKGLAGAVDTIGGIVALRDAQKQQMHAGAPPPRGLQQPQHAQPQHHAQAQAQAQQATVVSARTVEQGSSDAVYETVGASAPTNGAGTSVPPMPPVTDGPRPETVTKMVMARMPEDMRRPEWEQIILAIHAQEPPKDIAERVVMALDHFARFNIVPASLAPVFEHPRETLTQLLAQLPINSYAPDYGLSVLETVVRTFEEWQRTMAEAEDGEDPESESGADDEALVTPAPAS